MKPEWKPIHRFEGLYLVSNYGQVLSLRRGRILKPDFVCGYPRVTLCKSAQCVHRFVHVEVARAFLGPKPHGKEVDHKDRNRTNARLWNLHYLTKSQNRNPNFGERHHNSVLTNTDVEYIRKNAGVESGAAMARKFKCCRSAISKILTGVNWTGKQKRRGQP